MSIDSSDTESPVLIIGAGIAGLTCAVYLKQAGIHALVLEASDGVGGRIRTDRVDGFQLDRGFQILLTAYPEAQRLLNYSALNLQPFRSGALIQDQGQWLTLINPLQEPTAVFQTLASSVGTMGDKVRIAELMRRTQGVSTDEVFQQKPSTTQAFLQEFGFSDQIIERFFRPFFGGVFLEDALSTSSNFFEFCFHMFFKGEAAVPAKGMGAITAQLAERLLPGQIWLNTAVDQVDGNTVRLANGKTLTAKAIVLAVDGAQAAVLRNQSDRENSHPIQPGFNQTICTYFSAPKSPAPAKGQKLLILNTQRKSVVHHIAVMSDVAPTYAPDGQSLISVSTQGVTNADPVTLADQIQQELGSWFGNEVQQWNHLQTYTIPHALPTYNPEQAGESALRQPLQLTDCVYQCGDQTAYPSINAAMQTGREVAEMIIRR
ncbi:MULTISPECIES: NAD(P)/FAD-dependent oxidoreductase [unclassified Spirosoma]|uniref:protoporphyrinogen/coproporphyrinogen oxidase n=1 Tax=unclassified Spirosoma TaxID=2621999 RepID=UPI00095A0B03|nr:MULTISPECIES: NAD(P)/FAD-dependent oxidoreductase [unclassified Spirosoma]MBN8825354.1 FAD-dependent oxidoreductase [Spirosoma sp.]OJW77476.1 MAG: amine oxidase [Spirosoma sp. 48-14]